MAASGGEASDDGYRRWGWLETTVYKRLLEELATLDVELNRDKTRRVDLAKGESFTFLEFSIRRVRTQRGKWVVAVCRRIAARTKLLRRLKGMMRRHCSQPVERVIALINSILRGWTKLLPHRTIEPMFQSREGLGRERGTATPDATARAARVRLEEVE